MARKTSRNKVDPRFHDLWDRFTVMRNYSRQNSAAVRDMVEWKRLMGGWGSFVTACVARNVNRDGIQALDALVAMVQRKLAEGTDAHENAEMIRHVTLIREAVVPLLG